LPPLLAEFDIDCPAIRKVLGPCLIESTFTARQMLKDMQEVQANKNSQRELFLPPPLNSGQSLALDFSHNRLLHFEYVTPQIVGVSVAAAAVALNLHYTYPPENWDAGGDFMGIRPGTMEFQRGCRQPTLI